MLRAELKCPDYPNSSFLMSSENKKSSASCFREYAYNNIGIYDIKIFAEDSIHFVMTFDTQIGLFGGGYLIKTMLGKDLYAFINLAT